MEKKAKEKSLKEILVGNIIKNVDERFMSPLHYTVTLTLLTGEIIIFQCENPCNIIYKSSESLLNEMDIEIKKAEEDLEELKSKKNAFLNSINKLGK
ncbi:MAG: hypothetical protein WC438_05945 [Candidatus Pacearchaeota archaeon]